VEGLFVSERQAGDGSGHDLTTLAETKRLASNALNPI
jgi:hypothetical protein